ncbi:hypothetical protein RBWH47_02936 [Rhodopirellula baltica WH47]|uniref:Uncharacterized protein n=1 Tax=Rhodopirellula baltica WH47 TaxID=991778 RepID=F2B139_RHOBT|nr:hypothetical protein RBWH47_02936 [Rhodopirellula baltica WH47]
MAESAMLVSGDARYSATSTSQRMRVLHDFAMSWRNPHGVDVNVHDAPETVGV